MNWTISSQPYGTSSAELRLDEIAKRASFLPEEDPNYEIIRVQTSKLILQYQSSVHIDATAHLMSVLAAEFWECAVTLRNGDVILALKAPPKPLVDKIIKAVCNAFINDPSAIHLAGPDPDAFIHHYNLGNESELEAFSKLVIDFLALAQQEISTPITPNIRPMQPSDMAEVARRLEHANIMAAVRRQACVQMVNPTHGEVLFQEFYAASSALRDVLRLGNIDLPASRWLFRHLTNELDLQLLRNIPQIQLQRYPVAASFNLNLATIPTHEFNEIEEIASLRIPLFIELQNADILANAGAYPTIRDRLHAAGHKIVLDSIRVSELSSLNLAAYGVDYVKIVWTPDLLSPNYPQGFWVPLNAFGREKIIFIHCDKEGFLWGLRNGISHFQGFFTDRLIAQMTMYQCPKQDKCTLQLCVNRHRVLLESARCDCTDHDMLDMFPSIMPLVEKEEQKS